MARYARKLSVVGFALAAWYVYVLGSALWQSRSEHSDVPDLLAFSVLLGAIALPSGAALLLRRLAAQGPQRAAVRWLVRFWIILSICSVGWIIFVLWTIASSAHFYAYLATISSLVSIAFALASAVFLLGVLPPLWSLSRRPW